MITGFNIRKTDLLLRGRPPPEYRFGGGYENDVYHERKPLSDQRQSASVPGRILSDGLQTVTLILIKQSGLIYAEENVVMTVTVVTDYNGRGGTATGAFTRDEGALSDQDQYSLIM